MLRPVTHILRITKRGNPESSANLRFFDSKPKVGWGNARKTPLLFIYTKNRAGKYLPEKQTKFQICKTIAPTIVYQPLGKKTGRNCEKQIASGWSN